MPFTLSPEILMVLSPSPPYDVGEMRSESRPHASRGRAEAVERLETLACVPINVRMARAIGNIKYYFAAGGRADAY